ncbi:MAG TPA: hypothetical protein VMF60_09680, partial [Acidimicrobiales bacterium]|nr:hypothetical protein [Acidimicrobiales bacterium]
TGDTATSGDSDVYTVFTVETSPVYAEQPVELASTQLEDRCAGGWRIEPATGAPVDQSSGTAVATGVLDDDGSAVFVFKGASCAAGQSAVTADVLAGTHPTYTTTFTVDAPAPTAAPVPSQAEKKAHHRRHRHHKGTGKGSTDPDMTVGASPDPVIETGLPLPGPGSSIRS